MFVIFFVELLLWRCCCFLQYNYMYICGLIKRFRERLKMANTVPLFNVYTLSSVTFLQLHLARMECISEVTIFQQVETYICQNSHHFSLGTGRNHKEPNLASIVGIF